MYQRIRGRNKFPSFFGNLSAAKIHQCLWNEVDVVLQDEEFLKMNHNFHMSSSLIEACARAAVEVKRYADEEGVGPIGRNLVISYLLTHFMRVWTEILISEP